MLSAGTRVLLRDELHAVLATHKRAGHVLVVD